MCFIGTKTNSNMYTDLLEDVLISFLDDNMDENAIFQQDNASIHILTHTKSWFRAHNINVFDWPACSPDVNPIKNLWGILAHRVYANGRQFGNAEAFKQEIVNEWCKIDLDTLKTLIDSMPDRIFFLATKNGGSTKY